MIAKLRDDVAAAIDHDGQFRLGLFQKVAEDAVERRDVFDRQDRNRVHASALCALGTGGSTGIATGGAACWWHFALLAELVQQESARPR